MRSRPAVTVEIKARVVTVKGPRGTLQKSFKHMPVDIFKEDNGSITVEKWFGRAYESASIRTACSHMRNMFTGVTKVMPGGCASPGSVPPA